MNTTTHVLVAEDNPADQNLIAEAFRRVSGKCQIHFVPDGEAAIDFLFHRGNYGRSPIPSLIIVDLNLPKKDGL